jgi:hypothetical protein
MVKAFRYKRNQFVSIITKLTAAYSMKVLRLAPQLAHPLIVSLLINAKTAVGTTAVFAFLLIGW